MTRPSRYRTTHRSLIEDVDERLAYTVAQLLAERGTWTPRDTQHVTQPLLDEITRLRAWINTTGRTSPDRATVDAVLNRETP